MQAVSFPSSPTPPGGAATNPQPQSASRDGGGGFGQVLRTLSDPAPGPTPQAVAPDGMLADSAWPDDPAARAGAGGNLLLPDLSADPPADLPTSGALNQAEEPEAETSPATDLLALLVTGAAVAARLPPAAFAMFDPVNVVPAALFLVSEDAPSNVIMGAGAGFFHTANVTMTQGKLLSGDDLSPEGVAANFAEISDRAGEMVPQSGGEQSMQAMKLLQAKAG